MTSSPPFRDADAQPIARGTPGGEDAAGSAQRIRRSMLRAVTAVGVILVMVLGLAIGVVLIGIHAGRSEARARTAERDSQEQLWRSRLEQATMLRLHGDAGRRFQGLELVRKAVEGFTALHGSEPEEARREPLTRLRTEAAALLALPDVREEQAPLTLPPELPNLVTGASLPWFALTDNASAISLRHRADGAEFMRLQLPPGELPALPMLAGAAWNPAGDRFAAWWRDGSVAIWSVPDGRRRYRYRPKVNADRMTAGFSADGRYFGHYAADPGEMVWLDLGTGQPLANPLKTGRTAFAFRPGSDEVAVVAPGEVQLWDRVSGEKRRSWPVAAWPAGSYLGMLAWSPDGQRLAAMNPAGEISLWSLESEDAFILHGHLGAGRALAFSPDGQTLMSSSVDGETRWWTVETGGLAMVSSEGRGLGYDRQGGEILFERNDRRLGCWRIAPVEILQTCCGPGGRQAELASFDLSGDGRWLAAVVSSGLQVWDLHTPGSSRHWPMNALSGATFRPAGGLLLCRDGRLEVRGLAPGPAVGRKYPAGPILLGPPAAIPLPPPMAARTAVFSAEGHSLLVELSDRRLLIIDPAAQAPTTSRLLPQAEKMTFYHWPATATGSGRFALSPDGRHVAFGYGFEDGLATFDLASGAKVLQGRHSGFLSFSPDGRQMIFGRENGYDFLDPTDWRVTGQLEFPGLSRHNAMSAWSAGDSVLALAASARRIQLHEATSHALQLALTPSLPQSIVSCRLSPDGSRLAVAMAGNLVHLWDLRALRRELAPLGLDWPAPRPLPRASLGSSGILLSPFLLPALAAIALAAAAAWFVLRRHQHLIVAYGSSEALVRDRNRELEQARFRLVHGQKMTALGTLAAGVAHDFNNLLSVIRMAAKLIAREVPDHPEVQEHAEAIESAVLQGKQVAGSMLGYSRAGGGVPRQVAEVVSDTVALLSTEFLSGIALTLELDRDTPPVRAAGGRIEQILLNLVVNAAEAMDGRGRLTLSVRLARELPAHFLLKPVPAPAGPRSLVELTVRDSGPGIPPEIMARIFEPFFTTKNAGARLGTGLGLSTIYLIAGQEGLGLAVDSQPGAGTAFRIFLPVAEGDEHAEDDVRETPTATGPNPATLRR